MNVGIISSRYADALLRFVEETGAGEKVCAQVQVLEHALHTLPALRRVVEDPTAVTSAEKISLFRAALGNEPMAEELEKFLALLDKNGRITLAMFIFHTFIRRYYKSRKILRAHLVTAVAAPEELIGRLRDLMLRKTGCEILLDTRVEPSLIGGFVFKVDDYMLDASVSRQIETIRRQFVEKNRRIV